MRQTIASLGFIASCVSAIATPKAHQPRRIVARTNSTTNSTKISPKVFILNAFTPEANSFYGVEEFNLLEQNFTVPGFSPRFPEAHCTNDGQICQATTGEGEINAAGTVSALVHAGLFDLTHTYFLIGGIAGINPSEGTTGSVTFARFEVQVALQYEFDIRDLGNNFSTGYIPYGTKAPNEYPTAIYGTEVFEVNDALRSKAIDLAKSGGPLNDTEVAQSYRERYPADTPGSSPPSIVACDGATSDVFYSGPILAEAFDNFTTVITNGTGNYCATAQEDTAILSSLLRGAKAQLVDFSRIIVMRTAANFDRAPPGEAPYQFFFYETSGGFGPSLANLVVAGVPIIQGIVNGWKDEGYEQGIKAENYIGDIFGTLGGVPDFGPYPNFGEA